MRSTKFLFIRPTYFILISGFFISFYFHHKTRTASCTCPKLETARCCTLWKKAKNSASEIRASLDCAVISHHQREIMNESFKPFQLATSSSSNRKKNEFIYTTDNTCQPTCNGEIYTIVKKIRIFLVLFQSRGADGSFLLVDIYFESRTTPSFSSCFIGWIENSGLNAPLSHQGQLL